MEMKISILVMIKIKIVLNIKIDLIQKKLLNHLKNYVINFDKFNEEYDKFMDNIVKFEYYKSEKELGSVSPNQRKMRRYARDLKDIVDFYNLKSDSDTSDRSKSGSDTSKKVEGLKILSNKQVLNRLLILLAQI